MDENDRNPQMRFQQHGCPSSGINTFTGIPLMGSGSDCFYGPPCTGLDPIGSLNLSDPLGVPSSSTTAACGGFSRPIHPSDSIELDGRGLANGNLPHHLARFPSNPNLAHMIQKLPVLGGGCFSEMGNPLIRNSGPVCARNTLYAAKERMAIPVPEERQSSGERAAIAAASSPTNGKRKRDVDPTSPMSNPTVEAGGDYQRVAFEETSGSKESAQKKQKMGKHANNKQIGKQQAKDTSPSGEAGKDNYVHVRARRGQATNSHSLAERVRREKISERMKLLQELVPGCNKITGKALMLDEIINYVQSLQQQVEFLSMKLATVNPELNFDVDQILSKDVVHSRGNNTPVFGFTPGMNSSHPFPLRLHQSLPSIHNSTPPYHSMTQALWDGELQSLLSMDFNAYPAGGNLGPNGSSKTEL